MKRSMIGVFSMLMFHLSHIAIFNINNETFCCRCQAMERLVQLLIQDEDIDADVTSALGTCLCTVLAAQFTGKVFPEELNEE